MLCFPFYWQKRRNIMDLYVILSVGKKMGRSRSTPICRSIFLVVDRRSVAVLL